MKQSQIYNRCKSARAPKVSFTVIEANFVSTYRVRELDRKYSASFEAGGEGTNTPPSPGCDMAIIIILIAHSSIATGANLLYTFQDLFGRGFCFGAFPCH